MDANELLNHLPVYKSNKPLDGLTVEQIEMDHRKLKANSVFICIKGYTVDGHQFAQQAAENGAVLIVAEHSLDVPVPVAVVPDTSRALAQLASAFYHYPSKELKVIGVTGTNGKTSVTHMIDEIHRYAKWKTASIGTIQMVIDNEKYPVKNTTPDALFLQQHLRKMKDKKVELVTMEVSSHALDLGRVHGVDVDIAVFTNLSQDHLDYHETMEKYLFAKSLLFSQLGSSLNKKNPKYAIINVDEESADFLIRATAQPVISYGIENKAAFQAKNIQLGANGVSFDMKTPSGNIKVESKLMGMFSVYNMLAAAAACYASGIDLSIIKEALNQTIGIKGRFQPIEHKDSFGVIVDYAHTPDSLVNVLETIKHFSKGRIYVVVGCGGDRDRRKRPLMAEAACKYADYAIFTSDNPRSEDPEEILSDMIEDIEYDNYSLIVDRKSAIQYAIEQARKDDVILIAGKGHETYQIVGDKVLDFDDEQVARKFLR